MKRALGVLAVIGFFACTLGAHSNNDSCREAEVIGYLNHPKCTYEDILCCSKTVWEWRDTDKIFTSCGMVLTPGATMCLKFGPNPGQIQIGGTR